MANTKKTKKKAEEKSLSPSFVNKESNQDPKDLSLEPKEEQVGLLDTLGKKKEEAEKLDEASVDLAEENNIEVESDLLTKGEKFLSAIGYLSFLCILPLVLKKESEFCQFHGKQGLVILVFWIVLGFIAEIILLFSVTLWVLMRFLYIALACYGIYLGFTGQKKEIPIVGKIAKTLTW